MGIKQQKIAVSELTVGMFVSGLDRPWTQTPFPLQGFYVRSLDEIRELKVHCNHVYIDVVKGASPVKTNLKKLSGASGQDRRKEGRAVKGAKVTNVAPLKVKHNVYPVAEKLENEIGNAKQLHQQVYNAVGSVMEQVDSDHNNIPIAETKRVASSMVDSVLRSPDAFTWLSRVRDKDEYTYSHSVRSAVWAILFGRHIGMPKNELDILAMGVLLKDLGKTKLPEHLIYKADRNQTEQQAYEKFVEYGVDILRAMTDVKPRVTSVVKTHCERVNGSGFPQHLRADKIPLLGKIAGIVTFYDETINPRGADIPMSPSKAVAKLYEQRGVEFQEELVVEFIRAIGLYPTGTLVELSTGEVAVVVEQNFDRRLKPVVMVVTDAVKEPIYDNFVLDLAEHERINQAKIDSGKATRAEVELIEIVQDLEPGSYDIDIASIRDNYIHEKADQSGGILGMFKNSVRKIPVFSRS
ncbi:MAG: DUF3391 domain-containing protein [Agarilytica sp.]